MPYQSKTYSLSDEVIAAIEAAREQGETPNRFLRRVLGIDKGYRKLRPHLAFCGLPAGHFGVCRKTGKNEPSRREKI